MYNWRLILAGCLLFPFFFPSSSARHLCENLFFCNTASMGVIIVFFLRGASLFAFSLLHIVSKYHLSSDRRRRYGHY